MKKLIPLLILCACADERTDQFESWVGVYRVDSYRLDEDACSPGGPEADAPASHLLVEATLFEEDAIVRGLRCEGPQSCTSGMHFQVLVDSVSDDRLTGTGGDITFFPISSEEGACSVQVARLEMVREGDAVRIDVRRLDVRDVRVETEEACRDLVDELTDDDCVAFEEFEITQVR